MAINIAKVGVTMQLNTARFTSGLRKTSRKMTSFAKNAARTVSGAFSSIGKSISGAVSMSASKLLVLAFTVQRVARVIMREFKNLDEARKFAQSIGQAGEGATSKLLAFEFAGSRVGASSAVVRTALRNLSKSVGEAQMGIGEGTMALRMLGLEASSLAKMLPTDQFLAVSAAMDKMGNSSLKTAAAQKLFGKAGVRMLNLARQSGEAISFLMQRQEELQGVLSESDIAGVEAANDAINDLKAAFAGLTRTVSAVLADDIFVWFSVAADVVASLREKVKGLSGTISESLSRGLRNAIAFSSGYVSYFGGVIKAIATVVKGLVNLGTAITSVIAGVPESDPFELWGFGLAWVGETLKKIGELGKNIGVILKSSFELASNALAGGISFAIEGIAKLHKLVVGTFAKSVAWIVEKVSGKKGFYDEFKKEFEEGDTYLNRILKENDAIQKGLAQGFLENTDAIKKAWEDIGGIIIKARDEAEKGQSNQLDGLDGLIKKYEEMLKKIKLGALKPPKTENPFETDDGNAMKGTTGGKFGALAEMGTQAAVDILRGTARDEEIVTLKSISESSKLTANGINMLRESIREAWQEKFDYGVETLFS